MILSRSNLISLFSFATYKTSSAGKKVQVIPKSGIIVDPLEFKQSGPFKKITNWIKNKQTLSDMSRTIQYKQSQGPAKFLSYNNSLVQLIQEKNYKYLEASKKVPDDYMAVIKSHLKNNTQLPDYNLFKSDQCEVVQVRSHTDNMMQLKLLDTWYQVTCQFKNKQKSVYHVLQCYYKAKTWQFIKFNL